MIKLNAFISQRKLDLRIVSVISLGALFYGITLLELFSSEFHYWKLAVILLLFSMMILVYSSSINGYKDFKTVFKLMILIQAIGGMFAGTSKVLFAFFFSALFSATFLEVYIENIELKNKKSDIIKLLILGFILFSTFGLSLTGKVNFDTSPFLSIRIFYQFIPLYAILVFCNKNNINLNLKLSKKDILKSIIFFLIGFILVIGLNFMFNNDFNLQLNKANIERFMSVFIKTAIIEELFFRGVLLGLLKDKLAINSIFTIIVTALLFAATATARFGFDSHTNSYILMAPLFCLGIILGFIREKTKNPYASVLLNSFSHIL